MVLQRAAHDMKEPIRMVASFGALLRRRHAESLSGESSISRDGKTVRFARYGFR